MRIISLISVFLPTFFLGRTSATQYSTECIVQHDGKEVCTQSKTTEKDLREKDIPVPPPKDSFDERTTPFELGGLMVTQKSNSCVDESEICKKSIATNGAAWCEKTPGSKRVCRLSCKACVVGDETSVPLKTTTIGVAQASNGNPEEKKAVEEVLTEMVRYLREEVLVEEGYQDMYQQCVNSHELCAFWASVGECDNNPNYMHSGCMLACKKCNQHSGFMY